MGWRLLNLILIAAAVAGIWQLREEAVRPGRFPLDQVFFEGLVQTTAKEAEDAMAAHRGENLLGLSPESMRQGLLSLPWVREAEVTRVFPGTLRVKVREKIAVCLGLIGEELMLLDDYGMPIKRFKSGDPLIAPIITPPGGVAAPEEVVNLLNFLGRHPWLKDRISQAVGISNDRWVLYTRQGVRILLPAAMEGAVGDLKFLQDRYHILDRKVRQVDLRIPGRAAVKPEPPPKSGE